MYLERSSVLTQRYASVVLAWKPNELRQVLMPILEKLYRMEPESLPFRQAVDPVLLQIPVRIRLIH